MRTFSIVGFMMGINLYILNFVFLNQLIWLVVFVNLALGCLDFADQQKQKWSHAIGILSVLIMVLNAFQYSKVWFYNALGQ